MRTKVNSSRYAVHEEFWCTPENTSRAKNHRFPLGTTTKSSMHLEANVQRESSRHITPQAKMNAASDCEQLSECR